MTLSLLTFKDEQFGVTQSFEEFLNLTHKGNMTDFLKDRRQLGKDQKIEILLASNVDIPQIICKKGLISSFASGHQIIPIAIKRDGGI